MKRYATLMSICLAATMVSAPVRANETDTVAKTMFILDASGSMRARIGGETKMSIARRAMTGLLSNVSSNVHVGLMAYGHRRKGDCRDIEVLAPVGPANTSALKARVNTLQPKGKTPLSNAVMTAAEQLKYAEEKATVVLVSDGLETCKADPCALASALEKQGVDFTIHVVGFGLNRKQEAQLRCLADNTGGDYFRADNAGQLRDALQTTLTSVEAEAIHVPTKRITVKVPKKRIRINAPRITVNVPNKSYAR